MSIDNKVFPIYEGAQLRRRFTTEEEWKDWLRAHGAYVSVWPRITVAALWYLAQIVMSRR